MAQQATMEDVAARLTGVETRMTVLETRFETELPHLATKSDLHQLTWRLGGLIIASVSIGVAVLRFWN